MTRRLRIRLKHPLKADEEINAILPDRLTDEGLGRLSAQSRDERANEDEDDQEAHVAHRALQVGPPRADDEVEQGAH